tara:strand:+ start:369 stop:620 length:252 start_codon:yes stop_codon:yes gene_type:complete
MKILTARFYDDIPKSPKVLYRVIDDQGMDCYFRTEKQARDHIKDERSELFKKKGIKFPFRIEKLLFEYNLNSIMRLCDWINGY